MSEKFQCDECDYSSNKKYNLNRHKGLKHPTKVVISDEVVMEPPPPPPPSPETSTIGVQVEETVSEVEEEDESLEDYVLSLVKNKSGGGQVGTFVMGMAVGYMAKTALSSFLGSIGEAQQKQLLIQRLGGSVPLPNFASQQPPLPFAPSIVQSSPPPV